MQPYQERDARCYSKRREQGHRRDLQLVEDRDVCCGVRLHGRELSQQDIVPQYRSGCPGRLRSSIKVDRFKSLKTNKERQRTDMKTKQVKTIFRCQECGYSSAKWLGHCPECGKWNSFAEEKRVDESSLKSPRQLTGFSSEVTLLEKVSVDDFQRIETKI